MAASDGEGEHEHEAEGGGAWEGRATASGSGISANRAQWDGFFKGILGNRRKLKL